MEQGQIIRLNSHNKQEYIRAYFLNIENLQGIDEASPVGKLYNLFPEFRKQKTNGIKNEESRLQSITAFGLLGLALKDMGQNTDIQILKDFEPSREEDWKKLGYTLNSHGRPEFSNTDEVSFSMSHTSGMVLCVVADRKVGCDVELINRYKVKYDPHKYAEERMRLAQRFFCESENRFLEESSSDEELARRFSHIWTKKESYIKLLGMGLSKPLNSFNTFDCEYCTEVIYEDERYCASICVDLK